MNTQKTGLKVNSVEIADLRVPTSDTLLGSDPFHKKINYSCVYTQIKLSNGIEGNSVCFTAGAGNDWVAYGVKDIAKLLESYSFDEFINDHHQLRWLADGVNRVAMGCIINSL